MALLFVSSLESTRPTEQGMEPYRRRYLRDGPIPERRDLWSGDEVTWNREVGGPQQWNGGLLGSVLLVVVSIKGQALVSVLAVVYGDSHFLVLGGYILRSVDTLDRFRLSYCI